MAADDGSDLLRVSRSTRILGVDPGSRCAGFALVSFQGSRVLEVEFGVWKVEARLERAAALARLAGMAADYVQDRAPDLAAVEGMFHQKNSRTAFVLAEARGVLLSVLGAQGIPVAEYSPAAIKKTICGFGNADKSQVRAALSRTLPGVDPELIRRAPADASDALAVAVCHHAHDRLRVLQHAGDRKGVTA